MQIHRGMNKLEAYRALVTVAQHGSYSAAARLLGISKSLISRQISDLEAELGLQLLFRTTRQVRLTDAGALLFERCQLALGSLDEAYNEVLEFGQQTQGTLRVLTSDTFGESFVAPILLQMIADHPRLSVELTIADELSNLMAGEYDLAIRYGDQADSSLTATKIFELPHILVASPDYIARRGVPLITDDLNRHDCLVSMLEPCRIWRFIEDGEPREAQFQARWRSNNGPALIAACLAGLGICRLPEHYLREHIRAGRLQRLLADRECGALPVWAVFPSGRHVPMKTRLAVDYLRSRLPLINPPKPGSGEAPRDIEDAAPRTARLPAMAGLAS